MTVVALAAMGVILLGGGSPSGAASVSGPSIAITVTATPQQVMRAGDVVSYSITVTNDGTVDLHGVTVTDTPTAPAGPTTTPVCTGNGTLVVGGAAITCTATYTVTQADIDNAIITQTFTARGLSPTNQPVTASAKADTVSHQFGGISFVKSANVSSVSQVGDKIVYSFTVTNTGNIQMTGITINDVQSRAGATLDGPITCATTSLAPNASVTCTGTYTVTQADLTAGSVDDTATASATTSLGSFSLSPSSASVPVAALTVTKTLDDNGDAGRPAGHLVDDVAHRAHRRLGCGLEQGDRRQ